MGFDLERYGDLKTYVHRVQEALFARRDVWAEEWLAAGREPTIAELRGYLTPPLYVCAPFARYPVVLSPAGSEHKVRYVHDGSEVHTDFDPAAPMEQYHGAGLIVRVRVGTVAAPYGGDLEALDGPRYANGYLPAVLTSYTQDGVRYDAQAFCVAGGESTLGYLHWATPAAAPGARLTLDFESTVPLIFREDGLQTEDGRVRAWIVRGAERLAACEPERGETARVHRWVFDGDRLPLDVQLVVVTPPSAAAGSAARPKPAAEARAALEREWDAALTGLARIETPDATVNEAYKAMVTGTLMLAQGDLLTYSHGNGYQGQYMREIGWASLALTALGLADHGGRYLSYLLRHFRTKPHMELSGAGYRLQAAVEQALLTRDPGYVRSLWPTLTGCCEALFASRRRTVHGLLERERYAGDIGNQLVYNLRTNVSAWRGLRDFAALADELGERDWAVRCRHEATQLRAALETALARSSVDPAFIPIALFERQAPFERVTGSRAGSYYNLVTSILLEAGYFGARDPRLRTIIEYMHTHGSVLMGLLRSYNNEALRWGPDGWNEVYAWGYNRALLELDEIDRYVIAFFARLALVTTPGTYIGAEVVGIEPVEPDGRRLGRPPNCAANATFLRSLRAMLVHEETFESEVPPDTLKLGWATPRRWLEPGGGYAVTGAPTSFGPVDLRVRPGPGEVVAELKLPVERPAERCFLRLRLPHGLQWRDVTVDDQPWPHYDTQGEWIALSGLSGFVRVRLAVEHG